MKNPNDSSSDEELVFSTLGSSIDEAFLGYEIEEDCDDVEEDSYEDED